MRNIIQRRNFNRRARNASAAGTNRRASSASSGRSSGS